MSPFGNPERFAVGSEIVSVVQFGDDFGVVYDVIGLQRPIHRRDRNGRLTPTKKSVRDFPEQRDHADLLQNGAPFQ